MCNDEVTPYVRPPSTRKVHRGLQAQYLKELTGIRQRREALLDLRRQERVLTLEMKIMQLTRGHTKDPVYQEKIKARAALREDIHTRDNDLFTMNKNLRGMRGLLKKAEAAHLETRLALKTPVLSASFTDLARLRNETEQREREYKEARAVYQEAQSSFDDTTRRMHIAERKFQADIVAYHAYMKGRVRKKAKKVAAKAPEVRP